VNNTMNQVEMITRTFTLAVISGLLLINPLSVDAFQTVAYVNATIETAGPEGRLEKGTLVVRDGKIVAVGLDAEIPAEAQRVSLAGKTIMPGLIDPYFVFGREPRATAAAAAGRRRFRGVQQQRFTAGSFTRVREYFYPYKTDFVPSVRTGITTAQLVTDGRGQSAIARLAKEPSEEMLVDHAGFLFAKVTNQSSALDTIRNGLDPKASTSNRGGGRRGRGETGSTRGGRGGSDRPATGSPSKENGQQDEQTTSENETKTLWTEVREGKKPLVINVNNAATVAHVLKLMTKHDKVNLCLVATGPNLYQSLDEIRKRNVKIVLQPGIDRVPFTTERMNVARMIEQLEIPFALSMSLNEAQMKASQDDPMFPLAVLVKTGLSRQAAIQSVTLEPARMMGIDATHGSLEANKSADFLIFDGDPLSTEGRLDKVISQGKTIHEN